MLIQTKKLLLGAAAVAALTAACGPDTSSAWKQNLQIGTPLELNGDLAFLNRSFEQVHVVRSGIRDNALFVDSLRLNTGSEPGQIARSRDENTLFVVNEGERTLSVFDMRGDDEPGVQKVALGSAYDRISVDPEGQFVLLSFSGNSSKKIIARNLNELGIVDLRAGLPERAEFVTLFSRAQDIVFAPPFTLGGRPQRMAAALSPSEITLIDLEATNEFDRLRSVPLTISQADQVRNPVQVVFDTTPNEAAPDTISLYVLTDRGEDITQIVIQPSVREDALRKFDISVNQLAAGQAPVKMAVLDLPGVGTRLLALDGSRPRFTLVDVTSGESATFDLPITAAASDMLVFKTLPPGGDRVETRVLVYSTRSPLVAIIRPESIAVSGDTPTAGQTIQAIRAKEAPQRIIMDGEFDQDRAIAFHAGTQDGFTVFNLRTNRAIPIQGYGLSDLVFDGSVGYGVFRDSPHFVRFDLETGHPTVFDLPAPGRRIFAHDTTLLVQHADASGSFTVLDANEPVPAKARHFENVFFNGLFQQVLP
ncbi:MAG: hypothetical protein H0U74_18925 [Bradymonadaceae bacterium]|nr:hypothetical protein [Lujinxingiaceae bacterium]